MKKLIFILPALILFFSCGQKQAEVQVAESAIQEPEEVPGIVLTNEKYVPECKAAMAAMSQGDMDGFTALTSDDVVYMFNHGDSLVGKSAVAEWWNNRFETDLESVTFSREVWLSVDAVQPTYAVEPGDYVMAWFMVNGQYKTGNSMNQFIHIVYHFNADGKADRITQFVDRVPIMIANGSMPTAN